MSPCFLLILGCDESKFVRLRRVTGSKEVFEKVSISATDLRKGASTASDLAKQVTWSFSPFTRR